jgi:hypothetical protein
MNKLSVDIENQKGGFGSQSYSPSWFDRLSTWVDILPIPYWLVYVLMSLILATVGLATLWLAGLEPFGAWDPVYTVVIIQISYVMIVIHFLDKQALLVIDEFQPALKSAEQVRVPELKRLLSTLPARKTLLVCFLFLLFGLGLVLSAVFATDEFGSTVTVSYNQFGAFTVLVMLLLWWNNGLIFYHTYHQLRVVNYIYTRLTIVHPFHQRELFAFSGFSARTGILFIAMTVPWVIFDPGPVSLVICIVFSIFGLIAFISPLVGVHNILVREKDRLLDENGRQVEKAISKMMAELENKGEADLSKTNQTLSSLEQARGQIEGISTWPWKGETLRQLITAIILPLLIWLIQFLMAKYVLS